MKLTKTKLKQIIREEIQKLNENYKYDFYKFEMTPKEESAFDDAIFQLERKFKGKEKQINIFINSIFHFIGFATYELHNWKSIYNQAVKRKLRPFKTSAEFSKYN